MTNSIKPTPFLSLFVTGLALSTTAAAEQRTVDGFAWDSNKYYVEAEAEADARQRCANLSGTPAGAFVILTKEKVGFEWFVHGTMLCDVP